MAAVDEMARVLAPGGMLVLATEYILDGPKHHEAFTPAEIHALVDRPGLRLVQPIDERVHARYEIDAVDIVRNPFQTPHMAVKIGDTVFTSVIAFLAIEPSPRVERAACGALASRPTSRWPTWASWARTPAPRHQPAGRRRRRGGPTPSAGSRRPPRRSRRTRSRVNCSVAAPMKPSILIRPARSDDGAGHRRMLEHPRDGDLGRRRLVVRPDLLQQLDERRAPA